MKRTAREGGDFRQGFPKSPFTNGGFGDTIRPQSTGQFYNILILPSYLSNPASGFTMPPGFFMPVRVLPQREKM
jgi:hypothetical protein